MTMLSDSGANIYKSIVLIIDILFSAHVELFLDNMGNGWYRLRVYLFTMNPNYGRCQLLLLLAFF